MATLGCVGGGKCSAEGDAIAHDASRSYKSLWAESKQGGFLALVACTTVSCPQ
jgi:hypothetical protein